MDFMLKIIIRSVLAVVIGIIIGSERARHGRAAGARTHILVSLGAALTAMISIYANDFLGYSGDIFRLSAQVISGVGFLGAGVIILKSNNVITGLTTAAGVWTTSVIGIAAGCGFYFGAIVISVLYMITISLLGKLERRRNRNQEIYIEIDDMYKANEIISKIKENDIVFTYHFIPPKSNYQGNLGINLTFKKDYDIYSLKKYDNVVFIEEE
ncbi:MAG: MgtC/SapB family protein [Ruminococcaceae bacterium]|nr:MgtC/SapB family protein [Oscillospiraceae bacterium]